MKNVDYKSMLNDDSKTFDFDRLLERMTEDQERYGLISYLDLNSKV